MKKNIIGILIILITVFFIGCEETEESGYKPGRDAILLDGGIYTELDNVIIDITADAAHSLVDVQTDDGTKSFGSVTLTSGLGIFDMTLSELDLELGDTLKLRFIGTISEYISNAFIEFIIVSPISFTTSSVIQDDKVKYVYYKVKTDNATVDNVSINTKVGSLGTVLSVAGTWSTDNDSIEIIGSNYSGGDTIYYQVVANSGTLSANEWESVVIGYNEFPFAGAEEFMLDTTPNLAFDFLSGEAIVAGTDSSDIELVHVVGTSVGFVSNGNAMFVAAVNGTVWMNNDMVGAISQYEAGTPGVSIADAPEGGVYIFKITRASDSPTVDYYGMFKITSRNETYNGEGDHLIFEYVYLK